eukprot:9124008-Karenia_brevis.AAC.1
MQKWRRRVDRADDRFQQLKLSKEKPLRQVETGKSTHAGNANELFQYLGTFEKEWCIHAGNADEVFQSLGSSEEKRYTHAGKADELFQYAGIFEKK